MRRLAVFILAALALMTPALADGIDAEQYEAFGAAEVEEAVPESARDALGGVTMEDALDADGLLSRLADAALDALRGAAGSAAASALKIVAVCALCSLAAPFAAGEAARYITLAGCLAIAGAAFTEAGALISSGAEAVEEMNAFSRALLPCLTAAAAAGGMAGSAAAKYAATALAMDVLLSLTRTLLLPLAYALLAVRTAAAATGSAALDAAGKLIKWLAFTLTALVASGFTLYLSVTGAVAASADAAAARAVKTAVSAALPVVGGIISDAAGTIAAGAAMLRSAVGVLGCAVAAAICLAPFIALGARYLMYKAASVAASAFAPGPLAGLIADVGTVFALVLGVTGASAAMLFVGIISFVKAVGI